MLGPPLPKNMHPLSAFIAPFDEPFNLYVDEGGKGAFHAYKSYSCNLCVGHPPTPAKLLLSRVYILGSIPSNCS